MGKRLNSQRRGKGGPVYKTPSHRYKVKLELRSYDKIEREGSLKGEVLGFVDDPAHDAILMKVLFANGEENIFVAPEGIMVGDTIYSGAVSEVLLGSILPLNNIPEGIYVYNIESLPGQNGKFVRSPGSSALIVSKADGKVKIKMPSKRMKIFKGECRAQVGVISGGGRGEKPMMKASANYYKKKAKNKKWPVVRGVAQSPFSHPHGGKQHHVGKSTSISRNASPGQKVGHLASSRTGRKKRK